MAESDGMAKGQAAKKTIATVRILTGIIFLFFGEYKIAEPEFERGRVLEWQFQDAYGVRGMQRWEIEAAGDGTLVRMQDRYEMPGRWGKFFDWLVMRFAVARRDRGDLARLKRLVEHR